MRGEATRGLFCVGRMSYEMVVIRKHRPCLHPPAESLGRCQQSTMQHAEPFRPAKAVLLAIRTHSNEIGSTLGKLVHRRVRPGNLGKRRIGTGLVHSSYSSNFAARCLIWSAPSGGRRRRFHRSRAVGGVPRVSKAVTSHRTCKMISRQAIRRLRRRRSFLFGSFSFADECGNVDNVSWPGTRGFAFARTSGKTGRRRAVSIRTVGALGSPFWRYDPPFALPRPREDRTPSWDTKPVCASVVGGLALPEAWGCGPT